MGRRKTCAHPPAELNLFDIRAQLALLKQARLSKAPSKPKKHAPNRP